MKLRTKLILLALNSALIATVFIGKKQRSSDHQQASKSINSNGFLPYGTGTSTPLGFGAPPASSQGGIRYIWGDGLALTSATVNVGCGAGVICSPDEISVDNATIPFGSGTLNKIPLWTPDGNSLGNSIISQDVGATTDTITGALVVTGTVGVTGLATLTGGFTLGADSSANSHKITSLTNGSSAQDAVAFNQLATAIGAAVSGTANTMAKFTSTNVVGNSLWADDGTTTSYATNKFTILSANGNATVAGTLGVTGLSTLTGGFTLGADSSAASHKITNLTNGSSAQDAAAFGQIASGITTTLGGITDNASTLPEGNNNNFAPSGLGTTKTVLVHAADDSGSVITGIDAVGASIAVGYRFTLCNTNSPQDDGVLALAPQNTNSTAANRIWTPTYGRDTGQTPTERYIIGPSSCTDLIYMQPDPTDPTVKRWVVVNNTRFGSLSVNQLSLYPDSRPVALTDGTTTEDYDPDDVCTALSGPNGNTCEAGANIASTSRTLIWLTTTGGTGATLGGIKYTGSGTADGQGPIKIICNAGPGPVRLKNQSASSAVINRFDFGASGSNLADVYLAGSNACVGFWHGRDSGSWTQIFGNVTRYIADRDVNMTRGLTVTSDSTTQAAVTVTCTPGWASSDCFRLQSTSSSSATAYSLGRSSTTDGWFSTAGAANHWVNGTVAGDIAIVGNSRNVFIGTATSTTPSAKFDTSGNTTVYGGLTMGDSTADIHTANGIVTWTGPTGAATAIDVRSANPSNLGGISLLSNDATKYTGYRLGRTGTDGEWGVAGAADHFTNGSVAGDIVLSANGGKLFLDTALNTTPAVTISGDNVQIAGTLGVAGLSTLTGGFSLGADSSAASHKITNLTNGSSAQDAVAFNQLATAINAAVSGTTNNITKFTSTNAVGNANPTDDGTTFALTEMLSVTSNATPGGTSGPVTITTSAAGGNDTFVVNATPVGVTTGGYDAVRSRVTGTWDTTSVAQANNAINGSITSTRSAGAFDLTNTGVQGSASGGQINQGTRGDATGNSTTNIGLRSNVTGTTTTSYGVFTTVAGAATTAYGLNATLTATGTTSYGVYSDVTGAGTNYSFDGVAGLFNNAGAGTFGSTLGVTGLATLTGGFTLGADSSANSHKITSLTNGSSAQDAAAFGQIGTAVSAAVSGSTNTLAKFTSTNVIGNSGITDDGTMFDVNRGFVKFGTLADGQVYFDQYTVNYLYATDADATGYINWTGYNAGTTRFRNLIIADGKTATVATFTGTDKSLAVVGNLSTNASLTAGDATTDTHTINGSVTHTDDGAAYTLTSTPSALVGDAFGFSSTVNGTVNATASGRASTAIFGTATSTRSAGANTLTNYGGQFTASGAQQNIAVFATGTEYNFYGAGAGLLYQLGNLRYDGGGTFGDATTDAHTINGSVNHVDDAAGYTLTTTPSALVGNPFSISATTNGTVNATAGALASYGVIGTSTTTRSAGANQVTNYGVYGSASGAQSNVGVLGTGTQYNFYGAGTGQIYNDGGLSALGSATLGDTVADQQILWGDIISYEAVGATFIGAAGQGNLKVYDTTSMAAGVGGQITFFGNYTGTTPVVAGAIKAMKTNGTGGNYSFDLVFGAIVSGAGDIAEGCRLHGDTNVLNCSALTEGNTAVLSGTISSNVVPKGSSGNLADSSISDDGSQLASTDATAWLNTAAGSGSIGYFKLGADTTLSTNARNGYGITTYSDGNIYIDSKSNSSGTTVYRSGAGAETGAARTWLTVTNGTAAAAFAGNTTLGDAITDTTTINGATTIVPPSGAHGLTITNTQTGMTTAISALFTNESGSYNTTSGAITYATIQGNATATRSAGSNTLTGIGLYGNAGGAQVNYALYTDAGDNIFNVSSGGSTFVRNVAINGNATLGDSVTDSHTINGQVTQSETDGTAYALTVTPSAGTSTIQAINAYTTGTLNTTAGVLETYGVVAQATTSRSSGANTVTNYGVFASATNGQVNYALYTGSGDNRFNVTSGSSAFWGQVYMGDTSQSVIANNLDVFTIGNTGTAQTSSTDMIDLSHSGTFDVTVSGLTAVGIRATMTDDMVANSTNHQLTTIAVRAESVSSSGLGANNYGVYASANVPITAGCSFNCSSTAAPSIAYGIYATAPGTGTSYSGYFDAGAFVVNGAATINNTLNVTGVVTFNTDFSNGGTSTLGDAGADTTDVNGDLVKFGTTSTGDGSVYIQTNAINDSTINGDYASNLDDKWFYINEYGYNGGTTRRRNTAIYDGKGSAIATFTATGKAVAMLGTLDVTGAINGYTQITQAADENHTNLAVGAAANASDSNTFTISVAAGKIYAIDAFLIIGGSNTTGDYAFDFAVAAGTMDCTGNEQSVTTADAIQNTTVIATAAADTADTSVGTRADESLPISVRIAIACKVSNTTTLKYRFGNASAASGRVSRTMAGSIMQWKQLN